MSTFWKRDFKPWVSNYYLNKSCELEGSSAFHYSWDSSLSQIFRSMNAQDRSSGSSLTYTFLRYHPTPTHENREPAPATHPFLHLGFWHKWLALGWTVRSAHLGNRHAGIWKILRVVALHGREYQWRKLMETVLAIYFDHPSIKCMTVDVYSNIIFNNREPFIFLLTDSSGRNYMTSVFQRGWSSFCFISLMRRHDINANNMDFEIRKNWAWIHVTSLGNSNNLYESLS